jgi:glucokinase
MLLVGDVGGTKTTLGLFSLRGGIKAPHVETTFPSAKYPGLESMVHEFLSQNQAPVGYACFGVAGPVVKGRARITNLPWMIEEKAMAASLHLSGVHLLNDLEATAKSVPFLEPSDLAVLNHGRPDPEGAIAIIAPGTGLGEAFITREGQQYRVHSSEGGHADFAPANESQVELLRYLQERLDHVSYEDVCSGIGIRNIHSFFAETSLPEKPSRHTRELEVEDPVPLISSSALSKSHRCETCFATLNTFGSILGAEAGNLALKVLATGGVYLAGGIPRKVLPLLKDGSFDSFKRKGRMSQLVSRMPVHVILDPRAPLLGAARAGYECVRLNPKLSRELRAE